MRSVNLVRYRPVISIFIVLLYKLAFASAFKQCYYPDGSIPTDYIWEPCTGSEYSSCCVPSEGDICQPNGLCWYPLNNQVYRGACTDRTWNTSSCPSDICISGFETTWTWASECKDSGGSKSTVCGSLDAAGKHQTPTCANNAATVATGFVTTTSITSAHRYTPPPSLDSNVYSVWTSSYTTVITANVQTQTVTSIFASTYTSKISASATTTTTGTAAGLTGAPASSTGSDTKSSKTSGTTLSIGVLVAIIVGAVVGTALVIALFLFLRKKRSGKRNQDIRLNSADYPPPNRPVGADQVYPYEVSSNELTTISKKHIYTASRPDIHEIGNRNSILGDKKNEAATEMSTDDYGYLRSPRDYESLRSPAPVYTEAVMPVELDATSSIKITRRF